MSDPIDAEQIYTWLEEQAANEQRLLDSNELRPDARERTQERWLVYRAIAVDFREKGWARPSALIEAAKAYGSALRHQEELSTALHAARSSRSKDVDRLDREHGGACDDLGEAEHELLVCGAIVGGWTREDAEESV